MRKVKFISFWLLLVVSMATVVFNSCGKDDDEENTPSNPNVSPTTDPGVVINGIKWATRNVDKPGTFTAKPEDFGMFYQWNSNLGWSAKDPLKPSDGTSTWDSDWDGNGEWTWGKANDPCPDGWRMPSWDELNSLIESGSEWTSVNRVNGNRFGSGTNTIFLPAAGSRLYGKLNNNVGVYGYYWSTSPYFDYYCWCLTFNSNHAYRNHNARDFGYQCRCVAESN